MVQHIEKLSYKCGQFGHYTRNCKMRQNINNLNVNNEFKIQLQEVLLNSNINLNILRTKMKNKFIKFKILT